MDWETDVQHRVDKVEGLTEQGDRKEKGERPHEGFLRRRHEASEHGRDAQPPPRSGKSGRELTSIHEAGEEQEARQSQRTMGTNPPPHPQPWVWMGTGEWAAGWQDLEVWRGARPMVPQ